MRSGVLAAVMALALAACGGGVDGTPLPAYDDKEAIKTIADGLSDEGEFSDRKMFKSFMLGKEMYERGALKTDDTDRFVADTVEEAIAKHRKLKQESEAKFAEERAKREAGSVEAVSADCELHKKGMNGEPMVWVNGYDAGGENYPDPCAALEALQK